MSTHAHKILTSSKEPNWRTPKDLFNALNAEFNFALDAAASEYNHLCQWWFGPGSPFLQDALSGESWQGNCHGNPRVSIFCNPPYCKTAPIGPWVEKMASEGCQGPSPVIGVIPYSPQTKWWRKYIQGQESILKATEVRLFPYRLKFDPPEGYTGATSGANVNTAIVIWKSVKGFVEPWIPFYRYWDYQ